MSAKRTPRSKSLALAPVAAGLGALGAATSASAVILHYEPGPQTTPYGPFETVYVDVTGGVSSTSSLPSYNFGFSQGYKPNKPIAHYGNATPTIFTGIPSYVSKLNLGDTISAVSNTPNVPVGYFSKNGSGFWTPGAPLGFVGFALNSNTTPLYGWIRVGLNSGNVTVTTYDWAYETSGGAITIPESADAAFAGAILAGSAAVFARRRKLQRSAA